MDNFWRRTIWGFFVIQLCLAQIELNITCRYAGVYHVEKNGRYSISRTEAADLCKAFNSTLPTLAQMEQALSIGFETCRYGFIEGHVVIPRKTPRYLCAANNTGVYILASNTSQYDTYCFNASGGRESSVIADDNELHGIVKDTNRQLPVLGSFWRRFLAPMDQEDCSYVTDIPSAFEGQITIGIVNPDGTRYTKKGEYRRNPEDINPSNTQDDEMSSGSAGEKSTMGGSIIIQPTYYGSMTTPFKDLNTDDKEDPFTSLDSTTTSAGLEPNEESEEETEKNPNYSGSGIDDDEDFFNRDHFSTTSATTHTTSQETIQNQDGQNWVHGRSNSEEQLQTTTQVTAIVDMERSDDRAHGENSTQKPQPALILGGNHEDYDRHHSSSTTSDILSSTMQERTTLRQGRSGHMSPGRNTQSSKEETHATTETLALETPRSTTQETTTQQQEGGLFGWHSQPSKEDAETTAETMDQDRYSRQDATSPRQDDSWIGYLDPISHPMEHYNPTERNMETSPHHPTEDRNEEWIEDNATTDYSPMATQEQNYPHVTSRPHPGLEDGHEHSTAPPTSFTDGDDGYLPEDSPTTVKDSFYHLSNTNKDETHSSGTPLTTGFPGFTEATVFQGFVPGDSEDRSDNDNLNPGQPHWPHGYSTPSSGGNRDSSEQRPSTPRKPKIPEWLIILSALLALALILAVCIAVNSRRRCGQKKKLVINNGNGAVEDKKTTGLNGDASKSQEMVHLVYKEPSDGEVGQDGCITTDETRNLQNDDKKIGV